MMMAMRQGVWGPESLVYRVELLGGQQQKLHDNLPEKEFQKRG